MSAHRGVADRFDWHLAYRASLRDYESPIGTRLVVKSNEQCLLGTCNCPQIPVKKMSTEERHMGEFDKGTIHAFH